MIKNVFKIVLLSVFSLSVLTGCKKDKDADPTPDTDANNTGGVSSGCNADFSSNVATGKVHGASFTVVEGTASTNFLNKDEYRVTLYKERVNNTYSKESVIFSIPKKVGTYEISASRTVSFSKSISNGSKVNGSTCGKIEITALSAKEIKGKIVTTYDADNTLNGTFSVPISEWD